MRQTGYLGNAADTNSPIPGTRRQDVAAVDSGSVWQRPPKQQGNNLNLIVIVSDTFRRDNLGCYGKRWLENLETPNLDTFAKESVVFEDFYPEGMPTIVIRRNLYTGRRVVPCDYFRQQSDPVQLPGWHDLFNEDVTLSETLQEAGYVSSLISDLYHQQRPGRSFHRGFNVFQWIRGQEMDSYGTSQHKLLDVSDLVPDDYLAQFRSLHLFLSLYKANRALWTQEGESLAQIVAQTAIRWLKANFEQRPFYFHVEFFSPHEPWDPPSHFLEKYEPDPKEPRYVQPPYAPIRIPDHIKSRFRANYAGEVTCTDYWIGKLLDRIRELGLFENSIVVFMADHGAMLGEQGQFLKGPERLRGQVTHLPLMIRVPDRQYAGRKVSGLIQTTDLMPTLLHLLGLKPPPRVTGKNFWPLVNGETKRLYEYMVQTYAWVVAVRTYEWNYSATWRKEMLPGPYPPQLYNLKDDPEELRNVVDKYPDAGRMMAAKLNDYIGQGESLTRGSFHEQPSFDIGEVYVKSSR